MPSPRRLAVALSLVATCGLAQNLQPNPDFNDLDGVAGWSAGPGSVAPDSDDASECPASGSLLATSEQLAPLDFALSAHGPCLAFAETTAVQLRLRFRGTAGALDENSIAYVLYLDDACAGPEDGGGSSTFGDIGPEWANFSGGFTVLAGGSVRIELASSGQQGGTIEIDEIRVTTDPVALLDDFEGGGTCRWSAAVP